MPRGRVCRGVAQPSLRLLLALLGLEQLALAAERELAEVLPQAILRRARRRAAAVAVDVVLARADDFLHQFGGTQHRLLARGRDFRVVRAQAPGDASLALLHAGAIGLDVG